MVEIKIINTNELSDDGYLICKDKNDDEDLRIFISGLEDGVFIYNDGGVALGESLHPYIYSNEIYLLVSPLFFEIHDLIIDTNKDYTRIAVTFKQIKMRDINEQYANYNELYR